MSDFSKLMNLYWFIRYHRRNASAKRRYYRYASAEKKRLLGSRRGSGRIALVMSVFGCQVE